jgi:alpha-tubulin suppressor-like RCC1 family protein
MPQSNVPVQVVGVGGTGLLSGVTTIAADDSCDCAVTTTGAVYCWGYNSQGELGNNSTTDSNVPVQVVGVGGTGLLSGIETIAAWAGHTCAVTATGAVYCWGSNLFGQLGINSTVAFSNVPVQVVGVGGTGLLSGVTAIRAGGYHTCAVTTTGAVDCWGWNYGGALGNNSTVELSEFPVQVVGVGGTGLLSGIATIAAAGGSHPCALTTTGAVDCWGRGELGNNSTTDSNVPVQVVGVGGTGLLSGIATIASGGYHTCAGTTTGGIFCWGNNEMGQLGNNSTTNSLVPVEVTGF